MEGVVVAAKLKKKTARMFLIICNDKETREHSIPSRIYVEAKCW